MIKLMRAGETIEMRRLDRKVFVVSTVKGGTYTTEESTPEAASLEMARATGFLVESGWLIS